MFKNWTGAGVPCLQKSATGLSCVSVMTSVCPESKGEQTIARVGRKYLGRHEVLGCAKRWSSRNGIGILCTRIY